MDIRLFEVQFDKSGSVFQPLQVRDIVAFLNSEPGNQTSDIVVLSHGWNNDMDEARTLYRTFLRKLAGVLPEGSGRKPAAIGVLWPSKKFADKSLIPSGAASASDSTALMPAFEAQIENMKALFGSFQADECLDHVARLLPSIESDASAQHEFVRTVAQLARAHLDPSQASPDEGEATLEGMDAAELLDLLGRPVLLETSADVGAGGAAGLGEDTGGAAGLFGEFLDSTSAGALRLLNLMTYYVMKDRAGIVGRGVNGMLHGIQQQVPDTLRFHLAGHSFGGRLVTAAVDGPNALRVNTLLLLQAAFSHNAFAEKFDGTHDGFFRSVIAKKKVAGPILVTHSRNDRAVGLAYPLASRLNGDSAAAIGDANDRFGGIGRNGAQHMGAEARFEELQKAGAKYDFPGPSRVINLNGDAVIRDHGDVAREETAWALARAILS